LASLLKVTPEEILLTSGDTESSNLAIKGVALIMGGKKGKHIVTSKIEDFPVLNSAKAMERYGYKVTYLPVNGEGFVDIGELEKAITKETILVSIQHATRRRNSTGRLPRYLPEGTLSCGRHSNLCAGSRPEQDAQRPRPSPLTPSMDPKGWGSVLVQGPFWVK
jgi:hypothetical protein